MVSMKVRKNDPVNFATCLSCMDGRLFLPLIQWIQQRYHVDYVDMITEPGMDGFLARSGPLDSIIKKIDISIKNHGSSRLFIVGHADCSGNPGDEKKHYEDIRKAIARLRLFRDIGNIEGVWVSDTFQPLTISDATKVSDKSLLYELASVNSQLSR
jgi:carbonic anhydrase